MIRITPLFEQLRRASNSISQITASRRKTKAKFFATNIGKKVITSILAPNCEKVLRNSSNLDNFFVKDYSLYRKLFIFRKNITDTLYLISFNV